MKNLKDFMKNSSGNIIPMFALCSIAIILSAGVVLDYSRYSNAKQKLQSLSDAAVLAAVTSLKSGDTRLIAKKAGEDIFNSGLTDISYFNNIDTAITFDPDPTVIKASISVNGNVPTTLMQIARISEIPVNVEASSIANITKFEISLVLDVSISMEGSRIKNLKEAAEEFIDTLKPFETSSTHRVISIVPFSNRVNIGSQYSDWVNPAISNITYGGCMDIPPNYTTMGDNLPNPASNNPVVGQFTPYKNTLTGKGATHCPPAASEVELFGNDTNQLKTKVRNLELGFGTGTDEALLWGWRSLSPKWRPHFKGAKKFPQDYGINNKKILVLLTDGRIFNRKWDANHNKLDKEDDSVSITNFNSICNKLNTDDNIIVYTIGFNLGSAESDMQTSLENCAVNGGKYFNPTLSEIRDSFRSIVADLVELRLSS